MRNALLWGSQNEWLEGQFRRRGFAKKAVSKFMPGEGVEAALDASAALSDHGITAILTQLGENVSSEADVQTVVGHYEQVFHDIAARGTDTHISIKLTQLGLDTDKEATYTNLVRLLDLASTQNNVLWIDMEYSHYVDETLEIYRRARKEYPNIGVCVQAYLRRTEADLKTLVAEDAIIRLVKGAYNEPPEVAFAKLSEVNENYFKLARMLLEHASQNPNAATPHAMATHDLTLVERIKTAAAEIDPDQSLFEVDMLYGIRTMEQRRIADAGIPMRVLISYGESWFPWYMRRLAERPANVGFVLRSMFMR
jgi:proline dehydrogenase